MLRKSCSRLLCGRCLSVWIGLVPIFVLAGGLALAAEEDKDLQTLQRISRAFARITQAAKPAVVFIKVEKTVGGGTAMGPFFRFNDPFDLFGDEFYERFFRRRDMEDFFGRFFSEWDQANGLTPSAHLGDYPPVESYVDGQTFHITIDLPGIDPSDVDLTIEGNLLAIKGERKAQHEDTKDKLFRREMTYGHFARTFTLPDGIKTDEVHASYHNGVLDISLPLPEAMIAKKIPVAVEHEEPKQITA